MQTLKRYTGQGPQHTFRATEADNATEAAHIFAERYARKLYGSTGTIGAMHLDSYTENGSTWVFSAFVGYPCGDGISGGDVQIVVDLAEQQR